MRLHKNLPRTLLYVVLILAPCLAQSASKATVERLTLVSDNPLQLQIRTTAPVKPDSQIVSSPERLVIDIPNALPGPALHGMKIGRAEMHSVRVSLFSVTPPVTRIVVDLKEPQWYRVTPNPAGLLVSIGSDADNPIDQQSTIGWVSTQTARSRSPQASAVEIRRVSAKRTLPRQKAVIVAFDNGLMSIHSGGATLSEILYAIQKTSGAEIAIPAGTEQEKVAADFGPGTPSEVLGQLLNGTGLNFVVVGSEANPNMIRSVVLSAKDPVVQQQPTGSVEAYEPPINADVQPDPSEVPVAQPQPDLTAAPPQGGELERQPGDNGQLQVGQPQPGQPGAGPPPDPPPQD